MGLDLAEHGMYGYPEQFIPQPEYAPGRPSPVATPPRAAPAPATQMTADTTSGA